MEFVPNLLALAGMHILMAMLPGPNTVVIGWISATRSRREGLLAVVGVVVASLIWVGFALFGVGALIAQAGWAYRLMRLAGAAYLVFVGVRMLRAGFAGEAGGEAGPPRASGRSPVVIGLTTTLSNPKSAVFWTSAFLVAVPPHAPGWVHAAILAIVAVQSALWYGAVALFFSTDLARRFRARATRVLDLVAGGVMVLLGARVADEVRREVSSAVVP